MECDSVLVVEDDADLQDNICQLFEDEGYKVHRASNGQQALERLEELEHDLPGLIVLDLMMPVMSGEVFLETLAREHSGDWARIPILVVTALGTAGASIKGIPIHVELFRKPFSVDQLMTVAQRLLRKTA